MNGVENDDWPEQLATLPSLEHMQAQQATEEE